jgi:hypothetical protein
LATGKLGFDNPKISVNSRLFDDSDVDKIEVVAIDGRNLWSCCGRSARQLPPGKSCGWRFSRSVFCRISWYKSREGLIWRHRNGATWRGTIL